MKKLFLFLAAALSFISVHAQTFYSDNSNRGDSSQAGSASGDILVFNMLRAATGTVSLRWNVTNYSQNLTNGTWGFGGLCDNEACRPANDVLNSIRYTVVYGTAPEDFHAIFNADNAPMNSTAWVQVAVKDTAANGSSRTITLIATKTPLGVTTTVRTEDNIKVYPNPARADINVRFDGVDNIKTIGVYNLLGQPISMYHVVGSSANIPLTEVPSGVYFLRMYDGQGKTVATRRFTRQ